MEIIVTPDISLEDYTTDDALLQLYRYWLSKCGAKRFPSRTDIDPLDFRFALGKVSLVYITSNPRRFRYGLVSTTLTERLGYELTGKFVEDIREDDVRKYVTGLYMRALAARLPIYEKSRRYFDHRSWNHEALVLPYSSSGDEIDLLMIYRVTNRPNFSAFIGETAQPNPDPISGI